MAIEQTLERIAVALEALASQPAPTAAPAPVAETPAPAPAAAPTPPPAPAAPSNNVPFADTKGLIAYVTEAYQSMGPDKGLRIQDIMKQMGVENINNLPVEQYGQFYTAVEQLKAA